MANPVFAYKTSAPTRNASGSISSPSCEYLACENTANVAEALELALHWRRDEGEAHPLALT